MKKLFPQMYDAPENAQAVGGLSYGTVAFFVLPFTLSLFFFDPNSVQTYSVLEGFYQVLNFGCLVYIFRSYLADSWLNVSIEPKKVLAVVLPAAAILTAVYADLAYGGCYGANENAWTLWMGAMPMTGIELMLLPGQFILYGGIFAMLILVILGPITTACMYYATVFAPLCAAGHRFAAYLAVAALTAVPRFVTYFAVWGGWKEIPLYLVQLPIHLLACWSYQKADTIWAPIFTHAAVNVICCAVVYAMKVLGYVG